MKAAYLQSALRSVPPHRFLSRSPLFALILCSALLLFLPSFAAFGSYGGHSPQLWRVKPGKAH